MREAQGWLAPAAVGVLGLTLWRVVALALSPTDLFVDEAQYWLWGQEMAFGYYSKPPLIAWLIRAFTEIGSDSTFWVRLPAPLLHAVTALLLGGIAAQFGSRQSAVIVALAYATLPMVAVGSALISTDTVMFPFLAAALWLYLRGLQTPTMLVAFAAGLALGLAFLAKYAAVYYLLCGLLTALLVPSARPRFGFALLICAAFALTIAPNVVWNLQNGLTTMQHTLDNADWVRDPQGRAAFRYGELLAFIAAQFAVFGPVLFGALLIQFGKLSRGRVAYPESLFLLFALPIILVVCVQAFLSGAYANWAAAAYLGATLAVVPWLLSVSRGLLLISFAINGFIALALPVTTVFADKLRTGEDRLLLERYIGQSALSTRIIAAAERADVDIVVAENRNILADLFFTGRDSGLDFRAVPEVGRPSNHYVLKYSLPDETAGLVMLVSIGQDAPDCAVGIPMLIEEISERDGTWRNRPITLWKTPASCLPN